MNVSKCKYFCIVILMVVLSNSVNAQNLQSPTNGSIIRTNTNITFSWDKYIVGSGRTFDYYQLNISGPVGYAPTITNQDQTSYTFASLPDGNYTWYIKALNHSATTYYTYNYPSFNFTIKTTYTLTGHQYNSTASFFVNGTRVVGTQTFDFAMGSSVSLAADRAYNSGGYTYVFSHWSDGNANPERTITMNSDIELSMVYYCKSCTSEP